MANNSSADTTNTAIHTESAADALLHHAGDRSHSIILDNGCTHRPDDFLGGSGPIEYKPFKVSTTTSPHNSITGGSICSHGSSVTGFCRPEDFLGGSGEISYKPAAIKFKKAPWEKENESETQPVKEQRRWSRKTMDESQNSRGSTAPLDESANSIDETDAKAKASAEDEEGTTAEERKPRSKETEDHHGDDDDDIEINVEDLENDAEEEELADKQVHNRARMSRSEHMSRSSSDIMKTARMTKMSNAYFPKNSSRCRGTRRSRRSSKLGDGGSSWYSGGSFASGDSCSSLLSGDMSDGHLAMDDNSMQSASMNDSMPHCDIVVCNEQGNEIKVDLSKSLPNLKIIMS